MQIILYLITIVAGSVATLPGPCLDFNAVNEELQRTQHKHELQVESYERESSELNIVRLRKAALTAGLYSLRSGNPPTRRNVQEVADWFEAGLDAVIESAEARSMSEVGPAVAAFALAQGEEFGPLFRELIAHRLVLENRKFEELSQKMQKTLQQAEKSKSKIISLTSHSNTLLKKCLTGLSHDIYHLQNEAQTSGNNNLLVDRQTLFHQYLRLSLQY